MDRSLQDPGSDWFWKVMEKQESSRALKCKQRLVDRGILRKVWIVQQDEHTWSLGPADPPPANKQE